jgi:hypothetical protein
LASSWPRSATRGDQIAGKHSRSRWRHSTGLERHDLLPVGSAGIACGWRR